MINYTRADEWDLSALTNDSIQNLRDERCVVCLLTEIDCSREKAVLMNVFAPRGCVFWNFADDYPAFFGAHGDFGNYLLSRPAWKNRLSIINELCNPDEGSLFSFFLLGGLTRNFGEVFEGNGIEDLFHMHNFHLSIAAPANAVDAVKQYFELQLEYFGDTAFTRELGGGEQLMNVEEYDKLFASRLIKDNAMQLDACAGAMMNYKASRFVIISKDLLPPNFYPPHESEGVSLGIMSNVFTARAMWAVDNLPLARIIAAKNRINGKPWSLLNYAKLRNELRRIFDVKLANFPIIQTNPYENITYNYPPH